LFKLKGPGENPGRSKLLSYSQLGKDSMLSPTLPAGFFATQFATQSENKKANPSLY
jgi:hypothetical protein